MAAAIVGTPSVIKTLNDTGSTATVSLSAGNAGDMAFFMGGNYPSGFASVVGSVNGAYTKAVAQIDDGNNAAEIWFKANASASAETITLTPTVTSDLYASGVAARCSEIFTVSPLDRTGTANNVNTVTASAANTQAAVLVLVMTVSDVGTSNAGYTTPTGYTLFARENSSTDYTGFQASYKIVSASETSSATWTVANGGILVDSVLATFKIVTSAGDTALASSVSSVAAVSGALSTAIRFAGSLSAQTTVTGALTTAIRFARGLTVQSTVSGSLSTSIRMAGAASAQTTVTAALASGAASLAAAVSSAVTVTAALSTSVRLNGAAASVAQITAGLTTDIRPAASVATQVTVSASLNTGIRLAGAIQSAVTVSASLPGTAAALAGAVIARAQVSAEFQTSVSLAAQVIALAQASASLSTAVRLAALISSVTTVSGTLPPSETDLSDEWLYTVPGDSLEYAVPGDDLRITV